jgi:hypothetical protein
VINVLHCGAPTKCECEQGTDENDMADRRVLKTPIVLGPKG